MTTGEMKVYTDRFKNITERNSSTVLKTIRLEKLMIELEGAYRIPMLRDKEFEKANPFVMQLYRSVSEARVF